MTPEQMTLFDAGGWCQRWRGGRDTWRRPEDGGFDAGRYDVAEIDTATARAFVCAHHYSRSYPADRRRYGMFSRGQLRGVAVLGQPMHQQVTAKVFPTLGSAAAELSRFVLLDEVPSNAETWFLGQVFRAAGRDGLRGVVAFSDPMPRYTATGGLLLPGHIGHIYRAGKGATGRYTGRGTPRTLPLLPDGRVFSARSRAKVTALEKGAAGVVRDLVAMGAEPPACGALRGVEALAALSVPQRSRWLAQALRDIGVRTVRHHGNHRFAWAIGDRGARRRTPIALDALPYPTAADPAPAYGLAAR